MDIKDYWGVKKHKQSEDMTLFVSKQGNKFYIDREDVNTGQLLAQPGDIISFTNKKYIYNAEVTSITYGRDNDVYLLNILNKVKVIK